MQPKRVTFIVMLAVASWYAQGLRAADRDNAAGHVVVRIQLKNDAITPVTARFIERTLREAENERAQCLIIQLDTPGGLLDSTRDIVSHIIAARVPVVVYVSPSEGRVALGQCRIRVSLDPLRGLAQTSREGEGRQIVVDTHGRQGLSHLVMGSVAEQVVREAPCPVLSVRQTKPSTVKV